MIATVTELRSKIAALKLQRTAIIDAPISRADREAKVLAWAEGQSAEVHDIVHHHVASVAYGGSLTGVLKVRPAASTSIDLAPYLAHLLTPSVLAAALCKHFADVPEGLTDGERADQLAAIDADLFAAELAEERTIEASIAAGAVIARRADADPKAVLWLDDGTEPSAVDPSPPRRAPPASEKQSRVRSAASPYMARAAE